MSKTVVDLVCATCGIAFTRCKAEARRNEKIGRKTFCCLKCANIYVRQCIRLPISRLHTKPYTKRKKDAFSPFRYHLKNAKKYCQNRKVTRICTITLADLKTQWDKQNGICPYTGWQLVPRQTKYIPGAIANQKIASLDRIDSSRGYESDNIQFVCYTANCAKGSYTEEQFLEFCNAVSTHVLKTRNT